MSDSTGIFRLNSMADEAKLSGKSDVFLSDRDDWNDLRICAYYFTREPSRTVNGCHAFMFDSIEFKYRFRNQTKDDEYVECLQVAGMI